MPDLPRVVVTESLAAEPMAWLRQHADVVESSPDRVKEDLAGARGLVVRTYTTVNADLLDGGPDLNVVGRAGVALDNVDIGACRARGVEVVHTPGANSDAVAEFVFALIFDAIRPRVMLDKPLELGAWSSLRTELVASRQIAGSTIGIWGMGRIGTRIARIGTAFGATVLFHDIQEITDDWRNGGTPVSREELLERSDIVTLNMDEREKNRALVNADAFGRMRSDVVFVNCARGMVIDPVACAEFFVNHPGAIALLDVHDPEPFTATYPLLDINNVKLLPHIGAATRPAKINMSWVVRDVLRVIEGETPEHPAPLA
ncbi:MAG: NAD(P)-dependent oxidoreductase [Planctomycetota bacterium]